MGKDVVTFLSWAAEPEMEERKLVMLYLYQSTVYAQRKDLISEFLFLLVHYTKKYLYTIIYIYIYRGTIFSFLSLLGIEPETSHI